MTTPLLSLRIEATWNGEPLPPADWITVHLLTSDEALEIRVEAPLYNDPAPPPGPPGPTDGLWEHEVVEVFVLGPGGHYTEIELAPSGHHLVLRLEGVRQPIESQLPLELAVTQDGQRWRGHARLAREHLPPMPWRVNATAIHGSGARRTYLSWATLPGAAPDFHQLEAFRSVR